MEDMEIRKNVRERYGKIAEESGLGSAGKETANCCAPQNKASGCCNTSNTSAQAREASKSIGYSDADMDSVPDGANLGLGCGNPLALASLKEGETVLDLGSGAGFDCFLAANKVGQNGRVIGVDMTPQMLEKARENARKNNYKNVEFRMGEIENLPVADNTVDVITSNCVINLSVNKPRVFQEAYRVLKPGGRLMVSDIVLTRELPEAVRKSVTAYVGCVGGASLESEYLGAIEAAGFKEVRVMDTAQMDGGSLLEDPMVMALIEEIGLEQATALGGSILSIKVSAIK